jgi:hypothetical protein
LKLVTENNVADEWSDTNTGVTGVIAKKILNAPIFLRILLLPFSSIFQYFLPFNIWELNHIHPFFYVYINGNIFWWLVIGPPVIYSFIKLKNHANSLSINNYRFGVGMFFIIALEYGGVVPRYYFPFMPLLIMSGSSLLSSFEQNKIELKKYITFKKNYYYLLLIAISTYLIFIVV